MLIVTPDNTLQFRRIDVLRYEGDAAVVTAGLTSGERICISPLQFVVEGMPVTLAN